MVQFKLKVVFLFSCSGKFLNLFSVAAALWPQRAGTTFPGLSREGCDDQRKE